MYKKKPLFVTFEGIEGSGKSYQSKKLYQSIKERKIPVILTREPGGTKGAEKIRKIILDDYFYLDYLLIFMLVFIVGYPNFDAIYSTLTRIKNGKLPWIGDNNHPHYKFLKLGFSNIKILFVINGIHCFFILSAFLLLFYSKLFVLFLSNFYFY